MPRVEKLIGNIKNAWRSVNRRTITEGHSEDTAYLLAPGRIETFVRQGRTPERIGTIYGENDEKMPYYVVPPRVNREKVDHTFESYGTVYVYRNGSMHAGDTFSLNDDQAVQLAARIATEQERMRRNAQSDKDK